MQALGILLLSAGTLLLEVGLTRFFSLVQWYHFAFWSVSIALLGFGASGSFLSGFPRLADRRLLPLAAILFSSGTLGGYLVANLLPFDSFLVAWDNRQWLYLTANYLGLSAAFFGSGLALGILLSQEPSRANAIYAVNLVGSGLGALATMAVLAAFGTAGTVVVSASLGMLGAVCFAFAAGTASRRRWQLTAPAFLAALGILALLTIRPPLLEARLSPYKGLTQALRQPNTTIAWSKENSFSRLDVVRGAAFHSAPGLSLNYRGALPAGPAVAIDGEDLSPIPQAGPTEAQFSPHLLTALPYALRSFQRALFIEPGGGLDLLTALHFGVPAVEAVYTNPDLPLALHSQSDLLDDRRVRVVAESPRSYLHRANEQYDLIQVSLSEGFRAVTAGGHSLSENYLYTSEALADMYRQLAPAGYLVISRWLQVPPSEELRAFSLLVAALEGQGDDPAPRLLALRSFQSVVMVARREPWTEVELTAARHFAQERQFDLVYYPGMHPEEANQFNVFADDRHFESFQAVIDPLQRERLHREYPYDVRPTTDDWPFFFNFFRWQQAGELLQQYGHTWQPFGGGGYFVTIGALLLALAAALALIVAPLMRPLGRGSADGAMGGPSHQSRQGRLRWRLGLCFLGLGIGYLFLEIPLLQKFILLLGQPTYSFATVLAVLLMASGLGSLASRSAVAATRSLDGGDPHEQRRGVTERCHTTSLVALPLLAITYPWILSTIIDHTLGLPFSLRIAVSVALLLPLGFLMGIPFPLAVRVAGERAPTAIPWLWAVNGCASVVSAILAAMLALNGGFSLVMMVGALAYAGAIAALLPLINACQSTAQRQRLPDCG